MADFLAGELYVAEGHRRLMHITSTHLARQALADADTWRTDLDRYQAAQIASQAGPTGFIVAIAAEAFQRNAERFLATDADLAALSGLPLRTAKRGKAALIAKDFLLVESTGRGKAPSVLSFQPPEFKAPRGWRPQISPAQMREILRHKDMSPAHFTVFFVVAAKVGEPRAGHVSNQDLAKLLDRGLTAIKDSKSRLFECGFLETQERGFSVGNYKSASILKVLIPEIPTGQKPAPINHTEQSDGTASPTGQIPAIQRAKNRPLATGQIPAPINPLKTVDNHCNVVKWPVFVFCGFRSELTWKKATWTEGHLLDRLSLGVKLEQRIAQIKGRLQFAHEMDKLNFTASKKHREKHEANRQLLLDTIPTAAVLGLLPAAPIQSAMYDELSTQKSEKKLVPGSAPWLPGHYVWDPGRRKRNYALGIFRASVLSRLAPEIKLAHDTHSDEVQAAILQKVGPVSREKVLAVITPDGKRREFGSYAGLRDFAKAVIEDAEKQRLAREYEERVKRDAADREAARDRLRSTLGREPTAREVSDEWLGKTIDF